MKMPYESIESVINTAIEKIGDGIITKININEEKRNREFTYRLKELEYYKSNYEKDLKEIFNYWFDLVRTAQIKDNEKLTEQSRIKHQKHYAELTSLDKISLYKMTALVMWCSVLAVLKKDILGQDLDPLDIIRTLVNDYDDHIEEMDAAQQYIKNVYEKTYNNLPAWIGRGDHQ